MRITQTSFSDVYIIEPVKSHDSRGEFVKIFNFGVFEAFSLNTKFKESYYSISKKDTIRGMHFQLPPHDHEKLVYVSKGKIIDVIVDLRKQSINYGRFLCYELNETNNVAIYIGKGLAHGFISLENDTITNYSVTTEYDSNFDSGIRWNSFNFDWKTDNPIISDRDSFFVELKNFNSPF
jgi:dTDP-4-dehydrorhamnose 3,5-epimerase